MISNGLEVKPRNVNRICDQADDVELAHVAEHMTTDRYIANHGCKELIKVVVPKLSRRMRIRFAQKYGGGAASAGNG